MRSVGDAEKMTKTADIQLKGLDKVSGFEPILFFMLHTVSLAAHHALLPYTISVSLADTPTYNRLISSNLLKNGETCR